jgi:hypothetical protein
MDQPESQAVQTYHGSPPPNDAKLVIPTWIVALVAVAQAALFLWQLNSMREGILDATLAANAAKISADAANKAAEISFNQLKLGLDAGSKAERGLLITDGWEAQYTGAGQLVLSFKLKNTGRSPNYILAGKFEFALSGDFPPTFSEPPKDIAPLPGIIRQTTDSLIVIKDLPAMKEYDAAFLRVTVRYRDIYGSQYELVSTAKYASVEGKPSFQFPEVPVPKEQWATDAGVFAKTRLYNGHRQLSDGE